MERRPGGRQAPGSSRPAGPARRDLKEDCEVMAGANVLTFTDENFEAEVLKSDKPVLVDFWAEWCGPCRMIAPTVEALAAEYAGRVKVGKMNVDESPETPPRYQIRGIPTLLVFKNGQVADQYVGVTSKETVAKMLERAL
jgi:thioredoxin 1